MSQSRKYCRSLHARISLGTTSDDRFMPKGYLKAFAEMERLVLTEKLDGQNNCFTKEGVFARSHAAPSQHPWDKPLWERWNLIKDDLGDLEIFGENMYGIHSIAYKGLESYFYVFAVREGEQWLSWEDVKSYAQMIELPTVPELAIVTPLAEMYQDSLDEDDILRSWLVENLDVDWEDYVETPGQLGGYGSETGESCCEGFVIRNADSFTTNGGVIPVNENEFNNLFKLVRESHVQTDAHWTKTWKPAKLTDYAKYGWYGYEFTSKQ